MSTHTLERIEEDVEQLSLDEQLWLIEHLAHRIRQRTLAPLVVRESDLLAMTQDADIQRELEHIAAEFAIAEADGLHDTR